MRTEEVKALRTRLKSGEYNGADIMQAWLGLEDLAAERDRYREALKRIAASECPSWEGAQAIANEALM